MKPENTITVNTTTGTSSGREETRVQISIGKAATALLTAKEADDLALAIHQAALLASGI